MPMYEIAAPNGRKYRIEGPPGASQSEVISAVLEQFPDAEKANTSMSFTDYAKDTALGLIGGAGAVAQIPGQLATLAGATEIGPALAKPGKAVSDWAKGLQSEGLKAREALSSQSISEAAKDGILSAFATTIKNTITDPALLSVFIAEQLPQLVGPLGAAKVAKMVGAGIGGATTAGVGAGAAMQGIDIGADTYDQALKIVQQQYPSLPKDEQEALALKKARIAAAEAGIISLATSKLPGGRAIEKALASRVVGKATTTAEKKLADAAKEGRIKIGLKEAASEALEEGGGKVASNVGLNELDPNVEISSGVGQAAGLGAIGGGVLGGALGATHTEAAAAPGAQPGRAPIDEINARKAALAAEQEAAKAQGQGVVRAPLNEEQLFEIAAGPNGYGELERYKQQLLQNPKSPENAAALKAVYQLQRAMNVEDITRKQNLKDAEERGLPTAETSAFNEVPGQEQGKLFDEDLVLPEKEAQQEEVPEPTLRTDKGTQPQLWDTDPTQPAPITGEFLKANGARNTGLRLYKNLIGKDLNDPAQLREVHKILDDTEADAKSEMIATAVKNIRGKIPAKPETGAPNAATEQPTQPVTDTGGASPVVASEPSIDTTTGKPGAPAPDGVVPTGETAGAVERGEGSERVAVDERGPRVSSTEPPLREGLTPEKERTLRTELVTLNQQIGELHRRQAEIENGREVAEASGDTTTQESLDAELADIKKENKGLINKASRTFKKLFAEESGDVAEYFDKKSKKAKPKEPEGYPYNITDPQVILEEIQEFASNTRPEYKAYIEKYFKPSTKKKGPLRVLRDPAMEAEALAEGRELLNSIVLRNENNSRDPSTEEATIVENALKGKNPIEAAEWLSKNAPDADYRVIAGAVSRKLRRLSDKGVKLTLSIAQVGDTVPRALIVARGMNLYKFGKKGESSAEMNVWLNGSTVTGKVGVGYETALHELVHAATTAAIRLGNFKVNNNTPEAAVVSRLYKVHGAIVSEFNKRVRASKTGDRELSTFEQAMYQNSNNAFRNPDETISWALTSREAQKWLESVPYEQSSNLWQEIVQAVRSFLGLSTKSNTALSEVLQIGQNILEADVNTLGDMASAVGTSFHIQSPVGEQINTRGLSQEDAEVSDSVSVTAEKPRKGFLQKGVESLGDKKSLGIRQKLVDSFAPWNDKFTELFAGRVQDAMGNINPIVIMSQARDALRVSRAAMREGTVKLRESGLFEADALPEGAKSYEQIMADIVAEEKAAGVESGTLRKQYNNVLAGHRLYELSQKLPGTPMPEGTTEEDIAALERIYQNTPRIQEISEQLDTIRFSLIDLAVETGRISEERAQDWKDNTGYMPFHRINDFDAQIARTSGGTNRGLAALRNLKPYEGSTDKTTGPIDNFAGLVDWFVSESMRNQATVKAAETGVDAGFVRRGEGPHDKNTFHAYIDGERKAYWVDDPLLLAAFVSENESIGAIQKVLRAASKVLRVGVTATPAFTLSQVAQDIHRAYVYAPVSDPTAVVLSALKGFPKIWYNEVFGKNTPTTKRLANQGTVGTYDFSQESNLRNVLEEVGAEKRGLGATIVHYLEAGAKASDLAVREAIYNQVMKETGNEVMAESAAREIINFSRRGAMKGLTGVISAVPFMNAWVQGLDKLVVNMADGKLGKDIGMNQGRFYQRAMALVAMGTAYALMMQDDDEYQRLPDHVRDKNWVITKGSKELGFVPTIPVPGELAFFFKALPERVLRYIKTHGTDEEQTIASLAGDMLMRGVDIFSSPNITPQVFKSLLENQVNYSFMLGRQLESQSQMKLEPFQRFGMGTSPTTKWMAEQVEGLRKSLGTDMVDIGISPIKIENFLRGFFGSLAAITLSVTDAMFFKDNTARPLHQQWTAQVTGASTFMKDKTGTRYIDAIYKLSNKAEAVHSTAYQMIKSGEAEKAASYIESNIGLYAHYPEIKALMGVIQNMNDMSMTIDKVKDMPPEERRKLIDELRDQQNEIAKEVYAINKRVRDTQLGKAAPPQ